VLPKTDIRGYSVKFEGLLIKESLKDESVLIRTAGVGGEAA
jgi:predicted methyltransferase MtxX (methanogen marker protein 4)